MSYSYYDCLPNTRTKNSTSAGEIHPGVPVESEGVTAGVHLDVGPVGRDDPDLTIALHLDTPSVDALRDGSSQSQDNK